MTFQHISPPSNAWCFTIYNEDLVAYISRFVVRTLDKYISVKNVECEIAIYYKKRYGNLIRAFAMTPWKLLPSNIFSYFQNNLYDSFDDDPIDSIDRHAIELIKLILKYYFNLRIHHETTKKADQNRSTRIRSVYIKTILNLES
nr:unnamed protein product [Callosobruchus analis]